MTFWAESKAEIPSLRLLHCEERDCHFFTYCANKIGLRYRQRAESWTGFYLRYFALEMLLRDGLPVSAPVPCERHAVTMGTDWEL